MSIITTQGSIPSVACRLPFHEGAGRSRDLHTIALTITDMYIRGIEYGPAHDKGSPKIYHAITILHII